MFVEFVTYLIVLFLLGYMSQNILFKNNSPTLDFIYQ